MTPEERLEVLETLLAKVRRAAHDRGIGLPQDLPVGIFKQRKPSMPSGLTAFTETGTGTHAPLALVDGPISAEPAAPEVVVPKPGGLIDFGPPLSDRADTSTPARPQRSPSFDEEITSTSNPAEIEQLVLQQLAAEQVAAQPRSEPPPAPPPPERPSKPLAPKLESLPPRASAPPLRPIPPVRSSYPRSSAPLELDDLDDLVIPPVSVPKPPAAPAFSALERAFADREEAAPAPRAPTAPPPPPVPSPPPVPPTEPPPAPMIAEPAPEAVVTAVNIDAMVDEPVPESQRQKVATERPVDDALDGVPVAEEPPPESGEVESQRYASHSREAMDSEPGVDESALDAPTPQPVHDITAEVRALGEVDVIERPAVPAAVVASFEGSVAKPRPSFGELLDRALALAGADE